MSIQTLLKPLFNRTQQQLLCVSIGLWLAAGCTAVFPTATPTPTVPPTPTASPTLSATPTASQTASVTVTATATATETPLPSATPTAKLVKPTLGWFAVTPKDTPIIPIPPPMQRIKFGDDTINVLLTGSDVGETGQTRTDTIIVMSIDKSRNSVTMLSIPRDTYVFIPKNGMGTINTTMMRVRYAPDGEIDLLKQTILYNFGIPIHFHAQVDLGGFEQIVNALGGITVPVSCEFSDLLLKSPTADPSRSDSWTEFYVPQGFEQMDGRTAMWYGRLRKTTDDQDRSRRQQEVLRAIFQQARETGVLDKIPELYAQYQTLVQTDMGLWEIMQFLPMALQTDPDQINSYTLRAPYINSWGQDPKYPSALLPDYSLLHDHLQSLFTEPPSNRLADRPYNIELVNESGLPDLPLLSAYFLRQQGFTVNIVDETGEVSAETLIFDYNSSSKGTPIKLLQKWLHVSAEQIRATPEPDSPVQYRVVLGQSFDACPFNGNAYYPIERPTPTPVP
jgi:LCP family protein required for cell wall assembly